MKSYFGQNVSEFVALMLTIGKHGAIGNFILEDPIILGHETCAEVVAVGPDVKHLKAGDRVCTYLQRVGISPNSSYIRPIMPSKLLINCLKKREL
jgi:hypothetical protein